MPKNPRQTITPYHFNTKEISESSWKVLRFETKNPEVLVRYLVSKLVFTSEKVSEEETIVLFLAFESWVQRIAKHNIRNEKTHDLFVFRSLFQSLGELWKADSKLRYERLSRMFDFYRGKTFSRRYYYAIKGQILKLYELRVQTRFPKRFPPKAFVGKGYGDNGTARNKAFDGSPSWQDVAMTSSEAKDNPDLSERTTFLFQHLRVHQLQLITF